MNFENLESHKDTEVTKRSARHFNAEAERNRAGEKNRISFGLNSKKDFLLISQRLYISASLR